MKIKKVIICGLGALGLTYAYKLKDVCELKILANKKRIINYKNNRPILNGKLIDLDYILPNETWVADLIIISTKSTGLNSAIKYIKNFVGEKTIIISLVNGISSENKIVKKYPQAKVLRSYFIGHSAIRKDYSVIQDGVGKIVFEQNSELECFFKKNKIDFETSKDIEYSQWLKLGVNIILNQLSGIYKTNVGDLRKKKEYKILSEKLLEEVKNVAEKHGVKNLENYKEEVFMLANSVADDGITSMLQDIISKRKTEVDIFSGEIIKLGKKYKIKTTCNEEIYTKIKEMEREFL